MSNSWPDVSSSRPDHADQTTFNHSRSAGASRALHFAAEDDNKALVRALTSKQCLWQLVLTLIICSGVHITFTWGTLTNWNDHHVIDVCLFRWAYPDGYKKMPTSLAEAMPVDAALTAFFTCAGGMKRMDDVRRGLLPHVPPDALHRGPLWLLFPRGLSAFPRTSSLLGVTLVWGCVWGGLCLGLLSMVWAPKASLCLPGWTYIFMRAAWSTVEALMVSAGAFVLWCAHTHTHMPSLPPRTLAPITRRHGLCLRLRASPRWYNMHAPLLHVAVC